jgi:large repetitive protein
MRRLALCLTLSLAAGAVSGCDSPAETKRVPTITLSSSSASLTAMQGLADSVEIQVSNGGGGSLTGLAIESIAYGPGQPGGWLNAAFAEGTTAAPARLKLRATADTLPEGSLSAVVYIRSSAPGVSNSPASVAVALNVTSGPRIGLREDSLSISVRQNAAQPAARPVRIANGGGGTLVGLTLGEATYAAGQPQGWLAVGALSKTSVSAGTDSATFDVRPMDTALPPGTYTATVPVSATSPGAQNRPRSVTVRYTVGPDPRIELSPATATFAVRQNAAAPAVQEVAIRNGGSGTLDGITAVTGYADGQPGGWLSTGLSATTAPATLSLSINRTTLEPGTYAASVTINAPDAGNGSQTLSVSFTVTADPRIEIGAAAASFSARQNGASPAPQTVAVTNAGTGVLGSLSAAVAHGDGQPAGWLTATLDGAAAPATLTLAATTGALAPGTYTAGVVVTSPEASNSPQTLSVSFTVAPDPRIELAPSHIAFAVRQNAAAPPAQVVTIQNGGTGTLGTLSFATRYTQGEPAGWLSATASGETAPATLALAVNSTTLEPGTYSAEVEVRSPDASNSPQTLRVSYTVDGDPRIQVSPAAVAFAVRQNASAPAPQVVAVTNAGTGTLDSLAFTIRYAADQPTGWLDAALDGATAPAALTLRVANTGLAPGSYTATLDIDSPRASNGPQQVSVTYTVAPDPRIALDPTRVSFAAIGGGALPAARTVGVTNAGTGTLDGLSYEIGYSEGEPQGWLGATLSGDAAPAELVLRPTSAGLPPGSYTAEVRVVSPGAANSPQTVTVTYVIEQAQLVLSPTALSFLGVAGSPTPPDAQLVQVTATGEGTITGLYVQEIRYGQGQPVGWLETTFVDDDDTAPAQLRVRPGAVQPPLGIYTAEVVVASTMPDVTPRTFTVSYTVANPTPQISALVPESAIVGRTEALTLTIRGTDFASWAVVLWNGLRLPPTSISATEITVTIPVDEFATVRDVQVRVENPGPLTPTSPPRTFRILPAP